MILNDESTGVYSIRTENAEYTLDLDNRTLVRELLRLTGDRLRLDDEVIPLLVVANTIEVGKPMILMIKIIDDAVTMRQTSIVQDIERVE